MRAEDETDDATIMCVQLVPENPATRRNKTTKKGPPRGVPKTCAGSRVPRR